MADQTRGPDDLPERQAIRFGLRGPTDIVDCFVSWEALDKLEGGPAANRAERIARFERHRQAIEAAALAKCGPDGGDVFVDRIDPDTVGAH